MMHDIKASLRISGKTHDATMLIMRAEERRLSVEAHEDAALSWNRKKNGRLFSADNPAKLMALTSIWEVHGDDGRVKTREDGICDALLGWLS